MKGEGTNMSQAPGQETTLSMEFMVHEGMAGKHKFVVHVKTNDPTQPDKLPTVLSDWG